MRPPATAPATPITMSTIGPYPPSLTSFPVSQPVINPTMTQDRRYIQPPFAKPSLTWCLSLLENPCNATLDPVQLAVSCPEEVFDRLAALGIIRHADAYRKWGLLVVPYQLFANATRDDSCGCGVCLRQDDSKLIAAISRCCIDGSAIAAEHIS